MSKSIHAISSEVNSIVLKNYGQKKNHYKGWFTISHNENHQTKANEKISPTCHLDFNISVYGITKYPFDEYQHHEDHLERLSINDIKFDIFINHGSETRECNCPMVQRNSRF